MDVTLLGSLHGALLSNPAARPLSAVVRAIERAFRDHFPGIALTHYSASDGSNNPALRKYDEHAFLDRLNDPKTTDVELGAYPSHALARRRDSETFRALVSRVPERMNVLFWFDRNFAQGSLLEVLAFADQCARENDAQSGLIHDSMDWTDQNQKGPHWFKVTGRTVDPSKLKFDPVFQEDVIDLELNPCHEHQIGVTTFAAAWTVYLGPRLLDLLKVREIPATWVKLAPRLYRATLFSDPFTCRDPEPRANLWAFRRSLRIDEVAHQLIRG